MSAPISPRQQRTAILSSVLSSTPNSSLAATSVRATAASSRRVRRNWWGYIVENFRSISRTSKVLLIMSLIMVIIQVVVTVTVLVISASNNKKCDRPLDIFLIIYIIRVIIACPVNVYLYLNPRDGRRNEQNQSDGGDAARRNSWVDRLKSFLDLFATLWFIIGNYLLFTTIDCSARAPEMFILSLTWVILGYIIITIPILLCLAVIFCLPCVLVAMRVLHVGEGGISGASKDIIQKIPLVKYKALENDNNLPQQRIEGDDNNIPQHIEGESDTQYDQLSEATATTSPFETIVTVTPSIPQTVPRKKYRFRLFGRRKSSINSSSATPQILTIPNPADALCSICLDSYEDGEELRHLWCSHHFHKDCVDEWLAMNRRCPMCRKDVVEMANERSNKRGKGINVNNDDDDGGGEGSSNTTGQINESVI